MAIKALSYLGLRSDQIDQWTHFAGRLLGMQRVDRSSKTIAFRMDDRMQRLLIADETGAPLSFVGWEVERREDLDACASRLEAAGIFVHHGARDHADRRFVGELIWFHDPAGNLVELVHAPMAASEPFIPGRPIDGFLTGPLGMGHLVLRVENLDVMLAFYRDLLGFRISDYFLEPFKVYFLHTNPRHHSLAFVGTGRSGIHHLMVEFKNLDDVGQGYDLAQLEPDRIAYTLGRHVNDYMTSYYAHTPSGFFVESGWGGRQIDMETWQPQNIVEGPSLWGHERLYLTEEGGRKQMRDLRLDVARRGKRAPLLAQCPWLWNQQARQHP